MGFEVFARPRSHDGRRTTHVTVGKNGDMLYVSKKAHVKVGEPEYVNLLFDPSTRRAALEPTTSANGKGYRVAKSGKPGGGAVGARLFIRHYQIAPGRYDAEITDDGLLVFSVGEKKG